MSQGKQGQEARPFGQTRAQEDVVGAIENTQAAERPPAEHSPESAGNAAGVDLMKLIGLLEDFQSVERQIYISKLSRNENDTEHSYNLAMAAWLIIAKDKLPLDVNLVIKYALVHDLVEVYAGDTFALDDEQLRHKAAREHAALQRLEGNDLTTELVEPIREYESLADAESRFIYGLDKLFAAFTIIHNKFPVWRDYGMTKDIWQKRFEDKIRKSPYLEPYLEKFLQLLEDNPDLLADPASDLSSNSKD